MILLIRFQTFENGFKNPYFFIPQILHSVKNGFRGGILRRTKSIFYK